MIDAIPDRVFIDTSVVAAYLVPAIAHHSACVQFYDSLSPEKTRLHFSDVLRIEFGDVWFRLPRTRYFDPTIIRQFRLGAWDRNTLVRIQWMEEGMRLFERFLAPFEATVEMPHTLSI